MSATVVIQKPNHRTSPFHNAPCPYCGHKMKAYGNTDDPRYATRDHVFPRCNGGHATVRCCRQCNQHKAHFTLNEWRLALCLRQRRIVLFYYEKCLLRLIPQLILWEASKFLVNY